MQSSPPADVGPATDRTPAVHPNGSLWDIVALGGIAVMAVTLFALQSGTFFRGDDWFGLTAFHDGPTLVPSDGALSLTSGVLFGLVAELAGWNVWAYRTVAVASFVAALVAVYVFTRRLVDRMVAAAGTMLLATFTTATPLVTDPFRAHLPLSIAGLVILVRSVDGRRGGTAGAAGRRVTELCRRDVGAVVLAAVLLATSWVGVAGAVTVAVTLAAQHASSRRWLAFGIPSSLWLMWFATHGALATEAWSWSSRARYATTLLARTFQQLACNSSTFGVVLATAFVALLWTDPLRSFRPSWRPLRWLGGAAAYAVISTYRNGSVWFEAFGSNLPGGDTWVIAAFVVLAAAESLSGRLRAHDGPRLTLAVGAAGVALVFSATTLIHAVQDHRDGQTETHGLSGEVLAAVESVGRVGDDSWTVPIDLVDVPARDYHAIVGHLGSPLDFLDIPVDGSEDGLRRQDDVVAAGLGIGAVRGMCQWTASDSDTLSVEGPARVVVAAVYADEPAPVYMTRRAPLVLGAAPLTRVNPRGSVIITLPDDASGIPWRFVVGAGAQIGTCVD